MKGYNPLRPPRFPAALGCTFPALRLLLLFAVCLAGCAGPQVSPPAGGGMFYASPEIALRSLTATGVTGSVTATARIEIRHNGERYPAKFALLMQRPAQLRLESIPLFGPPDFFLSIDRGELCVFLPEKGAFYKGKATAANLSRFFPLSLPAPDIVSLLLGQPPEETAAHLQGEREEGLYRIDRYKGEKKTEAFWIDPAGDRLVRFRRLAAGEKVVLAAEFADHIRVGKGLMPQRVTLQGSEGTLTIRYTEILASGNDAAAFALAVPEGVTPMPLD